MCHTAGKEVNTTNTRIRKLRKALDLTQEEFGKRIGVKRNTVATYEIGRNTPIDAVVSNICREFHVREEWLRTGEGEMFLPPPRDMIDELIEEYGLPKEVRSMTEKFIALAPEDQQAVIRYVREVAAAIVAEAPAEPEKPIPARPWWDTPEEDAPPWDTPHVPPGYSSRAELEAEADEFAAMAREQFLSEKIPGYRASFVNGSGDPGGGKPA